MITQAELVACRSPLGPSLANRVRPSYSLYFPYAEDNLKALHLKCPFIFALHRAAIGRVHPMRTRLWQYAEIGGIAAAEMESLICCQKRCRLYSLER